MIYVNKSSHENKRQKFEKNGKTYLLQKIQKKSLMSDVQKKFIYDL